MRIAFAFAVVSMLATANQVRAEATKLPQVVELIGDVTLAARPVDNALVIAFGLSNFEAKQVHTTANGAFRLAALPSGVYRLIAVKQGFAPAVATVIPSAEKMRISLRLRRGKAAPEATSQIWEIRRSLPADILRQLDQVMAPASEQLASRRFAGEMSSLTGVAPEAQTGSGYAQTALAVSSPLPFGWSVDLAGRMGEETASDELSMPESRSSNISMALRTSGAGSVRVVSTKNSWQNEPVMGGDPATTADVQSHSIAWQDLDSKVEVRYVAQENLFTTADTGSEMIEIAGRRKIYSSDTNDVGVALRVWQESPTAGHSVEYRTADLSTQGRWSPIEYFSLDYGMRTRVTPTGHAWLPQTGFEVPLGKSVALVGSGAYKVGSIDEQYIGLPGIVSTTDISSLLPHYRYSLGVVSRNMKDAELSAVTSVTSIDRDMNLVFDQGFLGNNLWESYALESGDIHRDLTVACSRAFRNFAVHVATTAAFTESTEEVTKHFVTSHLRSLYRPSGTSLELAYRLVDQPEQEDLLLDTNGERLNVRVGQSLRLPLDLTVLLGMDFSRPNQSRLEPDSELQHRYVGGVSVAF